MIKIEKTKYRYGITLNRPEKRNALSIEMLHALSEAIPSPEACKAFRVLTMEGAGPVFCSGADLDFLKQLGEIKKAEEYAFLLDHVLHQLNTLNLPVIARVKGACMAGANGLLAVSDLVIAEKGTRFSFSEVKLGLVPAVVSRFVLEKISLATALDIMLTARIFDAGEALKMGLVNRLSTALTWDSDWADLLSQITSNAPEAMRQTRKLLRNWRSNPGMESSKQARELFMQAAVSAEAKTGISSFFEKKVAEWPELE